jgi:hypothetical protein
MAENIEFRLKVIEDKLGVVLSQNEKKAKGLGDALNVALGSFASTAAVKGISLLSDGFRSLSNFALDSVKAASESEEALNRLSVSLAQTGQLTEENVRSFEEFASQLQATTAFEDDAIITNAALIQSLARLDSEGLQRATKAAADLAATFNIDLESASRIVGKSAEGNVTALQKLGIEFVKGVNDAETFANVLQAIEQRFGGAAQAQAKTFGGAIAQLNNNFGDLQENIGKVLIQNPAIIAAFRTLNSIIVAASQSISTAFGGVSSDVVASFFRLIFDGANATVLAVDAVIRVFDLLVNIVSGAFTTIQAAFTGISAGILKLLTFIPEVGKFFEAASQEATASLNQLATNVQNNVKNIRDAFSGESFLGNVSLQIADAKTNFDLFYQEVKNKSNDLKNSGTTIFNPEDEAQANRIEQAKIAALEAERNYFVARDQLALENDIAERERFFAKTAEQLQQLRDFELQKSQIQLDSATASANLLATEQEKNLAKSKALREKEIRDLNIQNKFKADTRANDLANQQAFFSAASTLASSKSKELAAIGKAAAITEIAIRTPKAVAQSYEFGTAFGGPALGAALGAIAFTAMSAQAAKVAGVAFANGGIVGATMGGDNRVATIRDGEMVLNAEQQEKLFNMINAGGSGGDIVIQINEREIARAVRSQVQQGYRLA